MSIDIYKQKAKKIGVEIKESTRKDKKFDAFVDGVKQASFGAKGFMDKEKYKKRDGVKVAEEKAKAYKARHEDDRKIKKRDGKFTAGYLADQILW